VRFHIFFVSTTSLLSAQIVIFSKISTEQKTQMWFIYISVRLLGLVHLDSGKYFCYIANFVEFWLDPVCKTLQNLGSKPDLDLVNGKEMRHFRCEKAAFLKHYGLYIWVNFGLCLGLDWVSKNQDWTGSQNMTVHSAVLLPHEAKYAYLIWVTWKILEYWQESELMFSKLEQESLSQQEKRSRTRKILSPLCCIGRLTQNSTFFFRSWSLNFVKNWIRSLLLFPAGVCTVFINVIS